jgi:hypothetical protein
MADRDNETQYDTVYLSGELQGVVDGTSNPIPIVQHPIVDEGQLTRLHINCVFASSYDVTVTPLDTDENPVLADEETKFKIPHTGSFIEGDFEEPIIEVPALSLISVKLSGELTSADHITGVNVRIDERTG